MKDCTTSFLPSPRDGGGWVGRGSLLTRQTDTGVTVTLVPTIEELDVTWLARLLSLDGVSDVGVSSVGQGQVANCFRLTVTHDGGTSSVIAKVPSHDEVSRSTAALQRLYLREVS